MEVLYELSEKDTVAGYTTGTEQHLTALKYP